MGAEPEPTPPQAASGTSAAKASDLRLTSVPVNCALWERLAGALGFEPRYGGTKNRCLTTWRRPNRGGVFSEAPWGVQEGFRKNLGHMAGPWLRVA